MKKLFLMLMAVAALTFVSCDKGNKGGEGSQAAQEEEFKGQAFEGAKFTMQFPEWMKTTYTSDDIMNAADTTSGEIKMDATFSDFPCKPEDFKRYAENMGANPMFKDYKFDEPVINDNIMTFKGVLGEDAMTCFVVYLGEKAGVAGSFKYPIAKAADAEKVIMPVVKTIQLKK